MPARSSSIFPDLSSPPGWTAVPLPPQMRLVPPGTTLGTATATIILSPIAARVPQMPPPEKLVLAAIQAEASRTIDVIEMTGPAPAPSDWKLDGLAYTLRVRVRASGAEERRLYAVYSDERFMYGINLMAFGSAFDEHLDTFWNVARSIRRFQGRVVPPGAPPAPID
jgi:hypothetical protein